MKKQVLFLQGGAGKDDHAADQKLVDSLQKHLGDSYVISFPLLPEGPEPDFGRSKQIEQAMSQIEGTVVLVGHSLGASMLLKYLSENALSTKPAGIFLIATPFWSGDEAWKDGLKLSEDFAGKLQKEMPVFFYHCRDDEEVPFEQLAMYAKRLPEATIRELKTGGHQLNNDLSIVANDIKSL